MNRIAAHDSVLSSHESSSVAALREREEERPPARISAEGMSR